VLEKVERGTEESLSPRELEILLLVARGLRNRQISNLLWVSETPVKRYLATLYLKLSVSSRGEAIRKTLSQGAGYPATR
jgi:ATP/maltotriose-dependent transcriptional regulator MalT